MKSGNNPIDSENFTGRSRLPWIILAGLILCWIIFFCLTPPLPGGTDVFVFRDAGCNLADGRGLVTASAPHSNTIRPLLYAGYTPGAPLLFGLTAFLFGCSGRVDTFYNLAWAALACLLLYYCFSVAVQQKWRRVAAALMIGAIVPSGMVAVDSDRPEMPALCLLLAILIAWRRSTRLPVKAALVSLVGLVFLIHPFAGIAGWLLLAGLLIFDNSGIRLRTRFSALAAGTAGYALVVAVWAGAMWKADHTALRRFLAHALGHDTGVGVVLHSSPHGGFLSPFLQIFNRTFPVPSTAALIASLLLSGIVLAFYAMRAEGRDWRRWGFLLLVLVVLPLAAFPNQANYFGLARALLIAVLCLGGFMGAAAVRNSWLLPALVAICFVFTAPWIALQCLQSIEMRASYAREQAQARRIRAYFDHAGIAGPAMLADSGHYFLYKRYFPSLYDRSYLEKSGPNDFYQGLVLCYASSRAFSRDQLPWESGLPREQWRLIDSGEDSGRITLLGHTLMRRNWSWMCDVYSRL